MQEKVVGFHILSPNAGEITQGFAIGLKLGAVKADFDNLIGIHPTIAEVNSFSLEIKRVDADHAFFFLLGIYYIECNEEFGS